MLDPQCDALNNINDAGHHNDKQIQFIRSDHVTADSNSNESISEVDRSNKNKPLSRERDRLIVTGTSADKPSAPYAARSG
jgi:hypothetical protein